MALVAQLVSCYAYNLGSEPAISVSSSKLKRCGFGGLPAEKLFITRLPVNLQSASSERIHFFIKHVIYMLDIR